MDLFLGVEGLVQLARPTEALLGLQVVLQVAKDASFVEEKVRELGGQVLLGQGVRGD